jgi:hypothetical protein
MIIKNLLLKNIENHYMLIFHKEKKIKEKNGN